MKNINNARILIKFFLIIGLFVFGSFVYGEGPLYNRDTYTEGSNRSSTTEVKYEEPDTGSYWVENVKRQQINSLENQGPVLNLRIPVLLGVKVSNLADTWGDARSNGRTHEGIDIISPRGDLIVSPTDAVVTTIANSGNGGNHVFTANPGGERFYFAHLDSFAKGLMEGQVLKAGDLIGYVGNTGNASGGVTHLHFGIYQGRGGATNPFPRLTLAFSFQDMMNIVAQFLSSSLDALTSARSLANQYRNTFVESQASGVAAPPLIAQVLTEKRVEVITGTGAIRTLQLGSKGEDVKSLQAALGITADGSFGPKTKAAVVAFQISRGLVADGVFGAKSRALLTVGSTVNSPPGAGCTGSTAYSPTTGIRCN